MVYDYVNKVHVEIIRTQLRSRYVTQGNEVGLCNELVHLYQLKPMSIFQNLSYNSSGVYHTKMHFGLSSEEISTNTYSIHTFNPVKSEATYINNCAWKYR